MGKIDSSYPTILGGVSQAPFSRRHYARHEDQVNMMPDPVMGLVRRPGSVQRGIQEAITGSVTLNAASVADSGQFVGFDFQSGGDEYTVFLRKGAKPGMSQINAPAFCVNRSTNVLVPVTINPADTVADALVSGGVGSATAVGAMLVMAGKTITPAFDTAYPWAIEENQKRAVVWVRGGAYSRRYRIAMVRGNQKLWVEYTTLAPSYPVALDTTDLDPTASDYLKKVNDRTNLYNTAATKWINDALADIAPENIASQLAQTIRESGFLSAAGTVQVVGSSVCITDPALEDVESDDGGDGPLMRAAGNVVGAAELLTTLGYPGKVVQVRPGNSPDSQVFYLKARAKDRSSGSFTPVTWEECAGVEFTPTSAFVFLAVNAAGNAAYLSSDVAYINTNAGTNFPTYQASASGDATSNPPPEFFGKKVTNVAVFQDRLIVSKENGYVYTSRPGDYLNFFRASALTVVDDDPVSFAIIGGESDTVMHSLMYDRNLVLIGGKKQYLINGKTKLVPGSASATVMASIPNTTDSAPVLVEDRLFYTKGHNGYGSIHWFQPGKIAESPESMEATQEVTTYIPGAPFDMLATLTPDMVVVRVPGVLDEPANVYLYSYGIGSGDKRIDAVHRWEFDYALGPVMGMSSYAGVMQMLTLRQHGTTLQAVLDTIDLQPDSNTRPYLDSQSATPVIEPPFKAFGAPTYVGGAYSALADGEVGGWYMKSNVRLTSPSVLTGAGEPTRDGDTIVSALTVHMQNSSGIALEVASGNNPISGFLRGRPATPTVVPGVPGEATTTMNFDGIIVPPEWGALGQPYAGVTWEGNVWGVRWGMDGYANYAAHSGDTFAISPTDGAWRFFTDFPMTSASFWYSSAAGSSPGYTVRGNGVILYSVNLSTTAFGQWVLVTVPASAFLSGTADEIEFYGSANQMSVDDVTFTADSGSTPETTTWSVEDDFVPPVYRDLDCPCGYEYTAMVECQVTGAYGWSDISGAPQSSGSTLPSRPIGGDIALLTTVTAYPHPKRAGGAVDANATPIAEGDTVLVESVHANDGGVPGIKLVYLPAVSGDILSSPSNGGQSGHPENFDATFLVGPSTTSGDLWEVSFLGPDNMNDSTQIRRVPAGEYPDGITPREETTDCPDVGFVDCDDAPGLVPLVTSALLGTAAPENRTMSMTDVGTPDPTLVTDTVPYSVAKLRLPVGRRNLDYRLTLQAYHWCPLNITAIDWTGQFHYRTRRV